MKFLFNPSTDAPFNLALEEVIASHFADEAIMLWRNRNAVIVGRNQNTAAEVDAGIVKAHGIQVVRRMTGGGAVYHDLGNINFTISVRDRQLEPEAFVRNARVVLDALKSFGVAAEFSGRNDIVVDGRKISGSAKSVLGSRTLFHGTLLFSTDLSMLTRVLTPDPEKIRSKGIKSVRSRVANLHELLPQWDVENFLTQLSNALIAASGAEFMEIPEDMLAAAGKLADEKYRTWQWNYGTQTAYSYSQGKRFPFGTCRVNFNVADDRIADLRMTGDFFGLEDVSQLCAMLNGTSLEPQLLSAAIKKIPVEKFIHGATADDIISLFDL
ncbi:MAG: lipoate--protein ligase [Lentisphaeria bacterium]|nr:lipoate--protein ligase [Lentisphaeria bacterium]